MNNKRILILAANPQDAVRLRLETEVRAIRQALRGSTYFSQEDIYDRGAIQPWEIAQHLYDINPSIIHFCGHSVSEGLLVEDDRGKSTLITPEGLAEFLRAWTQREGSSGSGLDCIFLNSCFSEPVALAIGPYTSSTVGVSGEISDRDSIAFATGFYRALGKGLSIRDAFKLACGEIRLQLGSLPLKMNPVLLSDGKETRCIHKDDSSVFPNTRRVQSLWRLAYAFLRLDQLPSGGWSKTLANWMENIWEGDAGSIIRNPDMRIIGGTDLTVDSFSSYLSFLKRLLPPNKMGRMLARNELAERTLENLISKIGRDGGIGTSQLPRGGTVGDVRIRHTLMGVVAFLQYGEATQFSVTINTIFDRTTEYLVRNLPAWIQDDTHVFAMLGAALKLEDLLNTPFASVQISPNNLERLRLSLGQHIPQMMAQVISPVHYEPLPRGTIRGPLRGPMFPPYYRFWRMERSGFVTYLPYYLVDDGSSFRPSVGDGFKARCVQILNEIMDEIGHPFNSDEPAASLVLHNRHSETHGWSDVPRDWGVSAGLATLLQADAIKSLLIESSATNVADFEQKKQSLSSALLSTYDKYHTAPHLFRYTTGTSFAKVLDLFDKKQVGVVQLENLDDAVSRVCATGVTEKDLTVLVNEHFHIDELKPDDDPGDDIDRRSIRDMLVEKLQSGEHTPDGRVCDRSEWLRRVKKCVETTTVDFYNSGLADQHVDRYASTPREEFVRKLSKYLDHETRVGKLVALDVGCGAGQYAELLRDEGFDVRLLDSSTKMLELACRRLGLPMETYQSVSLYDANWGYPDLFFDAIFACAVMVHVPKDRVPSVYRKFYQLLKPNGVLFVNYKIGDHSLISEDGRFFEYYRDDFELLRDLENSGFRIEEKMSSESYHTMYGDPRRIRWVNFYCRRIEKR